MCGCSVKIGSAKDVKPGVSGIPLNGVLNDSFPALLSWGFCINPDKVKAAFKAKAGLDIADGDLLTLVKAHQLGNDLKVHKVNFLDVIRNVQFTQAERDTASCKVMLTR